MVPHVQAEAVLGKNRIEFISKGNELRCCVPVFGMPLSVVSIVSQQPVAQFLLRKTRRDKISRRQGQL